jgi:Secretion system C-terminal sorting domain
MPLPAIPGLLEAALTGFITPRTPTVGSGGTVTTVCIVGIQPITNEIPLSFKLFQNYPNPFNPTTKIKFSIPLSRGVSAGRGVLVKVVIFDILGREIAVLVNDELRPGTYEVDWNAENYPSGIYFCRLITQGYTETKKMVLLK